VSTPQIPQNQSNQHKTNRKIPKDSWHTSYGQPAIINVVGKLQKAAKVRRPPANPSSLSQLIKQVLIPQDFTANPFRSETLQKTTRTIWDLNHLEKVL
jgi:hypothetical protein